MTYRAVRSRINVVLFTQLSTDLFASLTFFRLPVELGNKLYRSKIRIRVVMALKTPSHRQLFGLIDFFHRIDSTVATHTAHTTIHVGGVIEVNVVRQSVNLDPWNRFA